MIAKNLWNCLFKNDTFANFIVPHILTLCAEVSHILNSYLTNTEEKEREKESQTSY